MADLFSTAPRQPLAEALRPTTLNELIGQTHLLGAGKAHSMILWGPPGVGKTTLARLMANAFDSEFIALSAVFAGVKDIRAAMDQARHSLDQFGKHSLLFVDEIQRFNKAVNSYVKQRLRRVIVQIIGLSHCFGGASRG